MNVQTHAITGYDGEVMAIPGAMNFTVSRAAPILPNFNTVPVPTTAGSTDPGTAAGALYNATLQKIRITPNATPGTGGQVRITAHYYTVTPPPP